MKRIYFMVFMLGALASLSSYAETLKVNSFTRLDKIIAIVDREAITQSELDKEIERTRKQMEHRNVPMPPQAELKKQVLDELIGRTLQMQQAKAKNIQVSEEDVNKAIGSIAKANKISMSQLKQAVEQTGVKYDDYHKEIHDQILLQKLQQQELAKNVTLTPDDVKKFIRDNKAKFNQFSAYHVIDILLPLSETSSNAEKDNAKNQANAIVKQLQTNKDTDSIPRQFSNAEINDLGWRSLAEIPSLFQNNVADLQVNGVSAPLQAPNGYHVLKLVEVKGQSIKPTENQLKNFAFQQKMMDEVKKWTQKLRNETYVKIMN